MPEGPEIRRAADNLEAAVEGKPLTDVWFAFEQLKPYQSQLIGQGVTQLETRGKALLTHFSNGLTLYSHNQLYGVCEWWIPAKYRRLRGYCVSGCKHTTKLFCSIAPLISTC